METNVLSPLDQKRAPLRDLISSAYDFQKLRIQMGNRMVRTYKERLGIKSSQAEKDADVDAQKILKGIRDSYIRITDGVGTKNLKDHRMSPATESEEINFTGSRIPMAKQFHMKNLADTNIREYSELVMADKYFKLMQEEDILFRQVGKLLEEFPIYNAFLKDVKGCGVAMAGVLIGWIDIHKAQYPSSIWAYVGLDVAPDGAGRSRRAEHLVEREYLDKDKKPAKRMSITFNPFVKTKLMGVMSGSMLKSSRTFVNGEPMSAADMLAMAKAEGFKYKSPSKKQNDPDHMPTPGQELADELEQSYGTMSQTEAVIWFLREKGHGIRIERSEYVQCYYDYKNRLKNMPAHQEKSDLHIHYMALRYMIKRFLVDFYKHYRALEGLVVEKEYSEEKLGIVHRPHKQQGNDEDFSLRA